MLSGIVHDWTLEGLSTRLVERDSKVRTSCHRKAMGMTSSRQAPLTLRLLEPESWVATGQQDGWSPIVAAAEDEKKKRKQSESAEARDQTQSFKQANQTIKSSTYCDTENIHGQYPVHSGLGSEPQEHYLDSLDVEASFLGIRRGVVIIDW